MAHKNVFNLLLLLGLSGCFTQHRMDFDLQKQALVSCNEEVVIRNITIREAISHDVIYQLRLKEGFKGSHIINFATENEGYDTGPNNYLKLKPNNEYIIFSVHGDSSLEMIVSTNSEGKVDSVSNDFKCLN